MADTFGTIVDKLSVVNVKIALWENTRRDKSLSDTERLAASDRCMELNAQRNDLVTELDEHLEMILKDPSKHKVHRKVANYNGGKV